MTFRRCRKRQARSRREKREQREIDDTFQTPRRIIGPPGRDGKLNYLIGERTPWRSAFIVARRNISPGKTPRLRGRVVASPPLPSSRTSPSNCSTSTRDATSSSARKRMTRSRSITNAAGNAMPPFSPLLSNPYALTTSRRVSHSSGNLRPSSCGPARHARRHRLRLRPDRRRLRENLRDAPSSPPTGGGRTVTNVRGRKRRRPFRATSSSRRRTTPVESAIANSGACAPTEGMCRSSILTTIAATARQRNIAPSPTIAHRPPIRSAKAPLSLRATSTRISLGRPISTP